MFAPIDVPDRKSWFVSTDSLYSFFIIFQRWTMFFAKSFDFSLNILSAILTSEKDRLVIFFAFGKEWYFPLESDIARLRLAVIFYSPPKLAQRISLVARRISLRSNITRLRRIELALRLHATPPAEPCIWGNGTLYLRAALSVSLYCSQHPISRGDKSNLTGMGRSANHEGFKLL